MVRKNPNLDITTAPSSNVFTDIIITDKNNAGTTYLRNYQNTNGAIESQVGCLSQITGTEVSNWIRVGVDQDGNTFTKVTASSNTDSIVTTKGISKSGNGYVKLGNGIIIQWGGQVVAGGGETITFPMAFTSTPRITHCAQGTAGSYVTGMMIESISSTSFTVHGWVQGGVHDVYNYWIAVGY
jgi:hypothetical protein